MSEIRYTRNLFLRCVNVVYLFAFASLYVQIPGLYGKNGILPARTEMDLKDTDFAAKLQKKPTLLWFSSYIGLDTEYMMDVLALVGMFLAFTGFISQKFCTKPSFAALWSLYYSLYQVGQTFMWFQWDILLLETGFLCILVSPMRHKTVRNSKSKSTLTSPGESISFWLVRWLLFRLMFSSGVVKLTSGCPSWWGLTALKVHFESMCIPTPLAWYSHHLPSWFLKLNTAFAILSEIALPPLFFIPIRPVRTTLFYIQAFFQVAIILTGNFNFFNYLTFALCLSLIDDETFFRSNKKITGAKVLSYLATLFIFGIVFVGAYFAFGIKLTPKGVIESKIAFSKAQFDNALGKALLPLIAYAGLSLITTIIKAIASTFLQSHATMKSKIGSILTTFFYALAACLIFTDSLVPFSTLSPQGNTTIIPIVREWHIKLSNLHLTNSYGLFRRITGVGGRPEVIIEGANNKEGPWMEYHFLYKPGHVNQSLPFVAPHQPRLDWQMWFAALGTYHQNPWIMSLAYRLLTGEEEVLKLMDKAQSPSKPPTYIRANLYRYHYTPWAKGYEHTTWTRTKVSEYFPIFTKDHEPLVDYLKKLKIITQEKKKENLSPALISGLNYLRTMFSTFEPPILMLALFAAGVAIIIAGSILSSPSKQFAATASSKSQRRKK